MPVVEFTKDTAAQQVDFPAKFKDAPERNPRDLKRSVKGALHVRPGIKVISVDEYLYIKLNNAELFRKIRLVALTKEEKVSGHKLPAPPQPRQIKRDRLKSAKMERLAAEKAARDAAAQPPPPTAPTAPAAGAPPAAPVLEPADPPADDALGESGKTAPGDTKGSSGGDSDGPGGGSRGRRKSGSGS